MIIKEYTIPVYRKIGSCELKATEGIRSDLYLKCDKSNNIELNTNSYRTEIYSRINKNESIIIYSNTTNMLLTNRYLNGTPLYQVISGISKHYINEFLELIKKEITLDYLLISDSDFYNIYLNTDKLRVPTTEIVIKNVQEIGDSAINRISNVSIRRLKDRLKITLNELSSPENYSIKLGSQHLLEPKYHKNWLEFYECVYLDIDQKPIHIYNHSYNFVNKVEAYKSKEYVWADYKDPFLDNGDYSENFQNGFVIMKYESYRSNLLIPTTYSEELHLYLNISNDPSLRTKNIIVSPYKLSSSTLVPILTKSSYRVNYNTISNNFSYNDLKECNSEGYTLVNSSNLTPTTDTKYNISDNIRIGNTRVLVTTNSALSNKENYITYSNTDLDICQENDLNSIPVEVLPTINKVFPTQMQNKLVALNNLITTYKSQVTVFPDKYKIYSLGE